MQSNDDPLDSLIAEYLQAEERGEKPDRHRLIEAHPDQAVRLAEFFADVDRIEHPKKEAHAALDATAVHTKNLLNLGSILGGRYKLLENIGEGGMGSVWVAEQQQPVKRRVAIKLVKAGMDSKQVLARFEAERQALAVMDHPNIAKVFDGGMTDHGHPYFVMEYVKGVPLTEYCDRARLSLKDRLKLFIPVCQAVQHAHHKGIVHRDLKPSNILICLYDGDPVPKVIDFGLAKALHQSLTDNSIYTGHGIMVGTPLYMSPEQAEHNNLDVDTRTDIYSLGVVLYELLTGTTPLERQQLQQAALDEVLRLIREVEPPRPSIRLSGSDALPSIAAQRSIDPRELRRSLAGDLDWIVMKSLEKERGRRYETANGFARDIQRFLDDEAVEACPPSTSYRVKKFIRKHKGKVIAASAVFVALVVGMIGTTWGLFRATTAERKASRSQQAAIASEKKALDALDAVTQERDAKERQRELAERQLISGLLRPIGYGDQPNTAELRSFVDWSAIPDSRLKLRILEIAFEDPEIALRVARRAERAMQACVALSPTRRAQAIKLVSAKQRDLKADPRIRVAAVWITIELGSNDLPNLAEALTYVGASISAQANSNPVFRDFIEFIGNQVEQLTTEQVVRCWDVLIPLIEKSSYDNYSHLSICLAELTTKLNSVRASQMWNAMVDVWEKSEAWHGVEIAETCLNLLAAKLNSEHAEQGWNDVIRIWSAAKYRGNLDANGKLILALLSKRGIDRPQDQWNSVLEIVDEAKVRNVEEEVWNGLLEIAPQLGTEQVTHAWRTLITTLYDTQNERVALFAGQCFSILSPKLSADEATRSADAFILVLESQADNNVLTVACCGLMALASRLSSEQEFRGVNAIISVLNKNNAGSEIQVAAWRSLVPYAPKLTTEQVTRCADAVIAMLELPDSFQVHPKLEEALVAFSPRFSSEQAIRVWDAIINDLRRQEDVDTPSTGRALISLAYSLGPDQRLRCVNSLRDDLDSPTDNERIAAVTGLVAIATTVNSELLIRVWDSLVAELPKSPLGDKSEHISKCLIALTEQMTSEQLMHGWKSVISITPKLNLDSMNKSEWRAAGTVLAAISTKLGPNEALSLWGSLIGNLENSTNAIVQHAYRMPLEALTATIRSEHAARCSDQLLTLLQSSEDVEALQNTGNALASIAVRLPTEIRLRATERMLESLHRFSQGHITEQLYKLVQSLELPKRDQISSEATTILVDYIATSPGYYSDGTDMDFETFKFASMAMCDAKSVATMLRHPACVNEPRDFLLRRFEELLFHDGQHVLLTPPDSGTEAQPTDAATPKLEPPPRRFHNMHDAAEWIQKNWPDFDLETSQPVTWRAEN